MLAVNVIEDVTEETEARLRERFLTEAGKALASSLDYEETLQRVARLAVPRMADWCAVELPDERGMLQQVALAHVDPEKVSDRAGAARALAARSRRADREPRGAALGPGAELYPRGHGGDAGARARRTRSTWRASGELGLSSGMVVPMVAGGRTLGVMTFVVHRRAGATPRTTSPSPRSSPAARPPRSRTRASTRSARPPRARCRRACCRSSSRPCRAGARPPTTAPARPARTWAATSTTSSRSRTAPW